jgi:hypothetical protein
VLAIITTLVLLILVGHGPVRERDVISLEMKHDMRSCMACHTERKAREDYKACHEERG